MLRLSKTFAALVIAVPFVAAQSAVWGQVRRTTCYDLSVTVLILSSLLCVALDGVSLLGQIHGRRLM